MPVIFENENFADFLKIELTKTTWPAAFRKSKKVLNHFTLLRRRFLFYFLRVVSVLVVGWAPVGVLLEVVAGHDPGEAVVLGQGEAHRVDVGGRVLVGYHPTYRDLQKY